MAPKKKPRLSSRATSTLSGDIVEQLAEPVQTPIKQDVVRVPILSDSWTDEQETSLFKGMIRWKPVGSFHVDQSISPDFTIAPICKVHRLTCTLSGMLKHFRMIAISQHLRNHGYTSQRDDHTRIPYIWEKLRHLYNLDALDERVRSILV